MLNLTKKFLDDNIKRCRDAIKYHTEKTDRLLNVVGSESKELSKDAFWAQAQLDAYVRTVNFMNDEPVEVTDRMSNEEACRTAIELFINECIKESFDWKNAPPEQHKLEEHINKSGPAPENLTRGFMWIVYYWYNFQRKK